MADYEKITDAELAVLQVLWEKGEPVSSTEIYQLLKSRMDWEKSTVRTLVNRLHEKGILGQEKRNVYFYTPLISEKEYASYQTRTLLAKLYGGDAKSLVTSLLDNDHISEGELREITEMWEKGFAD